MRSGTCQTFDRPRLIFVVEDHDDSRDLMRQWLECEGFEVAAFSNGRHAVDEVLRLEPDVIVMDGRLPEHDGWHLTRDVRSLAGPAAQIPIVFVSAAADTASKETALRSGCDVYLTKPVDLERLSEVVTQLFINTDRGA
jgi:CheY-like chemotaxis protein